MNTIYTINQLEITKSWANAIKVEAFLHFKVIYELPFVFEQQNFYVSNVLVSLVLVISFKRCIQFLEEVRYNFSNKLIVNFPKITIYYDLLRE